MSAPPEPQPPRGSAGLWLLLALYALLFMMRLLGDPAAFIRDEELHTPTVAALLAGGLSPLRLPELQYMPFCGGCTVETLLITPAFWLFGPIVALWKLIPLAFALGSLALCWRVARIAGGVEAAALATTALLLAPPALMDNALVGFGSHAEVSALILLALMAWGPAPNGQRPALRFGLASGLALFFAYAAAPTIAALALLFALRRPAKPILGAAAAGLALGLVPWALIQLSLALAGQGAGLTVYGRGPGDLLDAGPGLALGLSSALGPIAWRSLFHPALPQDQGALGLAWVLAMAAGWALLLPRPWARSPDAPLPAEGAALAPAALLSAPPRPPWIAPLLLLPLAHLGAYVLFAPPLGLGEPGALWTPNQLRYLTPMAPLLALAFGVGVPRLWAARPLRALPLALAGALLLGALGGGLVAHLVRIPPGTAGARALTRLAVDRATLRDRLLYAPAPLPGGCDAQAAAALMDGLPTDPFARPLHLFGVGSGVGQRLIDVTDEALQTGEDLGPDAPLWGCLGGIAELKGRDREAAVAGLVDRLHQPGDWEYSDPRRSPGPALDALLRARPDLGWEVAGGLIQGQRRGPEVLSAQRDARAPGPYRRGLAWAYGRARCEAALEGGADVGSALDAAGDAPEARLGAADAIGEAWGDSPAVREALARSGPDGAALCEAFDDAAARIYRWPAGGP